MMFDEYCDAINAEIVCRRYHSQGGRWLAQFENCEVSENEAILKGAYGNGQSPGEAIRNYIKEISGEKIVFNAMSEKYRREFIVPEGLTYDEA